MINEHDIHDFTEYQKAAWSTALPSARNCSYLVNGLSAETGEVCGLFAKYVRDGSPGIEEFREKLRKELGDVLWFVAGISTLYGMSLDGVMQANLDKLKSRMERGVIGGSGDDR